MLRSGAKKLPGGSTRFTEWHHCSKDCARSKQRPRIPGLYGRLVPRRYEIWMITKSRKNHVKQNLITQLHQLARKWRKQYIRKPCDLPCSHILALTMSNPHYFCSIFRTSLYIAQRVGVKYITCDHSKSIVRRLTYFGNLAERNCFVSRGVGNCKLY